MTEAIEREMLTMNGIHKIVNADSIANECSFKMDISSIGIVCKCSEFNCKCFYSFIQMNERFYLDSSITKHTHIKEKGITKLLDEYLIFKIVEIKGSNDKMRIKDIIQKLHDEHGELINDNHIRYLIRTYIKKDWITAWRCVPDYIKQLHDQGINAFIQYSDDEEKDINHIYIEMPYSKEFIDSKAFPGVLVIDGTFLRPMNIKGTLLILSAITCEKKVLPLCFTVSGNESNESYEFLFESSENIFTKKNKISVIGDQHPAIISQIKNTNEKAGKRWIYIPCAFHLVQKFGEVVIRDFFALIKSNNAFLFEARLILFKNNHPKEFSYLQKYISQVSFIMGAEFRFGYVSQQSAESVNSRLENKNQIQPIEVIDELFNFGLSQYKAMHDSTIQSKGELMNLANIRIEEAKQLDWPICEKLKGKEYIVEEIYGLDKQKKTKIIYNVLVKETEIQSCSCKRMNEILMPCHHIIAVGEKYGLKYSHLFNDVYKRSSNLTVFGSDLIFNIPNLNSLRETPDISIINFQKTGPGRPTTFKRIGSRSIDKRYINHRLCKVCKLPGHYSKNKYKCKMHPDYRPPVLGKDLETELEKHEINEIDIQNDRTIIHNADKIEDITILDEEINRRLQDELNSKGKNFKTQKNRKHRRHRSAKQKEIEILSTSLDPIVISDDTDENTEKTSEIAEEIGEHEEEIATPKRKHKNKNNNILNPEIRNNFKCSYIKEVEIEEKEIDDITHFSCFDDNNFSLDNKNNQTETDDFLNENDVLQVRNEDHSIKNACAKEIKRNIKKPKTLKKAMDRGSIHLTRSFDAPISSRTRSKSSNYKNMSNQKKK